MASTSSITVPFWRKSVFNAEWRNVCLVSYAVDPERLRPLVPEGLTLDVHGDHTFVSLVAFEQRNPRFCGVPVSGSQGFAQVNFRFYVHEGKNEGVVFMREDVPVRSMAIAARAFYGEPFRHSHISSRVQRSGDGSLDAEYVLFQGKDSSSLWLRAVPQGEEPQLGSEPRFLEQLPYAYQRATAGHTRGYEVTHSLWKTHQVVEHHVRWDFGALYGPEWADLADLEPHSVLFAEGSPVHASLPVRFAPPSDVGQA